MTLLSISNGFNHLGTIITAVVLVGLYTFSILYFRKYLSETLRIVLGVIVFLAALAIGLMESPLISNGAFYVLLGVGLACSVIVLLIGSQGKVDAGND